ncbi:MULTISPECIES: nitrite reductase large subunit NirB [unclassified Pseudomonas]|uniref:nitrite reductase large subunit NirB n=1 Tax=unclassified Pseudomonas TaxID=196821 RepID=UPI000BD0438F|nr:MULTISPECIES: nitrite reductase large subunit NirB [unclassified Pseudomonas]PVZ16391.1 nitrite reductase (NADH) large subunit [Pseudomonas sp. URIL14HWK12:I12]PVZ25753.1 nitrite reductase (NADH) large subunit [Pseudomonas sp. URIL14HWK12:I10]PVZ36723.1 nitrite reductase (NADH) large subunit [Pseudomonas sp. URIL14HWK12:I11]SNZ12741.1 nitrite reductase (NADH) large subunit [Pseudomonas sp. URIL14HWK12:I9]
MNSELASDLQTLVIIGNGMVGHHCVEQLVENGALSRYHIHVFSEEPLRAYDRVHLSEYFTGRDAESLALGEAALYQQPGVTLHLGTAVLEIDRAGKQVITANGSLAYTHLVMATGSYPFVPPIEGAAGDSRLVYRTLADLDTIRAAAANARRGVVVGGGLLGLEAANALRSLGLEAHVVEFAPRLMPVQLDEAGGVALKARIEALGVQVHLGRSTESITPGEHYRFRMNFAGDQCLETDLVVFSAGIRPHDGLARACGLELGARGGIAIDSDCRSSDPHIHAIGECAAWNGSVFGLVAPGYQMARNVAAQLCQRDGIPFLGADMSTKLKLLGVDVGSIGDAQGVTAGARSYRFIDEATASYRRLVVSADGKRALGAVLVGDNSYYDTLLQYIQNGIALPADPSSLILPQGEAAPSLGVDALPATATVCSCHNVSKGAICCAIDAGCSDLAGIKQQTKAGTGCGGCAGLLKQVFEHELIARGVTVDKSLCEHFAFTRQELYSLVRVEGIETFDELLARHGKGHLGCDICKPAVGSILASCWNRPIMEPWLVPLQDTNDTFMANMQKNGTYSVVPRIPAGEITPEGLIAIGAVAKKYDLYTKITGGQRIDLFGAQLHELPDIWAELIAAGFETGHAYGKSTRTVKSCVGNTWCRYGVQDSVQMALHIENRYKGLRSPHKLKFAVSGCTRECAEAQSKDVGVIATEKGWNLYISGNGGMRPRHAELLATDLDDETLIRYIDRFLMLYIRTADKLQRTSVWRESLEGGLDYLKAVIIDDSLGLAAELEAQMQLVVDRYECEWANALGDPEKLKRFRTFVNASGADPDVRFIKERGQRRPARAEELDLINITEVV